MRSGAGDGGRGAGRPCACSPQRCSLLAHATAPGGKILLSTIAENEEMMKELLDVHPCAFMPSIPNLVYQYKFFTNYESEGLSEPNPEIPID